MKNRLWKLLYAPSIILFFAGLTICVLIPGAEYLFIPLSIAVFAGITALLLTFSLVARKIRLKIGFKAKNRQTIINSVSAGFFILGTAMSFFAETELLLWLTLALFLAGALLFIIPTLFVFSEEKQVKYILAYKLFIAVFIFGIPTIAVSVLSIALFAGVTAFLITDTIKTLKNRAVFYILSLALSVVFVTGSALGYTRFADVSNNDEALGAMILLIFAGMIFFGLAWAFIIRWFIWWRRKTFRKKVLLGTTGLNLTEPYDYDDRRFRSVAEVKKFMKSDEE